MRLTHEPLNTDIIDMELIELKFMFDRGAFPRFFLLDSNKIGDTAHHDNRDFVIIPNYQPHCKPTLNEQSLLFGTSTGVSNTMVVCDLNTEVPSVSARMVVVFFEDLHPCIPAR